MNVIGTIKKGVDKVLEWFCILILAVMTALVTYQVITRYFFNAPSEFSQALAQYLFVWLVMFGSAYVFGLREHMNIAFIRNKLPTKARIYVEILGEALIACFAVAVMIVGGYSGAMKQMIQRDATLPVSVGVIYSSIPICGWIIVFYFIYNVMNLIKELKSVHEN